jgi:hypothetical protein
MSLPKQDESIIKPLTGDSPIRRLGEQNSPLKPPINQATSEIPANKQDESIKKEEEKMNPNEEEDEEETRLLYDSSQLVTIKKSDYISPLELTFLQSKYMVLHN